MRALWVLAALILAGCGDLVTAGVEQPFISPVSGPAEGGTTITVYGEGFRASAQVRVGGQPATAVAFKGQGILQAVTPPGPVGPADVVVLHGERVHLALPGAFTYQGVESAQVSTITPASGPAEGGTEVTLIGSGFTAETSVVFGGRAAREVVFINDQLLQVVTPPSPPGAAPVTLFKPGTSPTTAPTAFEFVEAVPEVPESEPPRLLSAQAVDHTHVLLSFSEALDPSAADARHYTVAPALVVVGATLRPLDAQVLLETTPMTAGATYTVTAAADVTDRAGNGLDANANAAAFDAPLIVDDGILPRVVGAVSTGNTEVLVRFSRPMGDSALVPAAYAIVQENVHPEAAYLGLLEAAFVNAERTAVQLTTYSQSAVTYRVTVSDVADLTGQSLAPKTQVEGVLIDPTTAVFAGTAANAGDGTLVDSDGDGLSDARELRGWVVSVTTPAGVTHK
ncbi:MAG: IPT/TIG domain-containing protein, partial [Myxococcales bacterium]|nr:IPT/TIG domain-containing protein [Myxococcales bacterium]